MVVTKDPAISKSRKNKKVPSKPKGLSVIPKEGGKTKRRRKKSSKKGGRTIVTTGYATYRPTALNTFRFSNGLPPLVKVKNVIKNKRLREAKQKAIVQKIVQKHTNAKKHTIQAVPIPADKPIFIEKPYGKEKKMIKVSIKKSPGYYAPEHGNHPPRSLKAKLRRLMAPKTHKLRSSLFRGKVCIIVRGRYRGKRCIFLKQLDSGLCLINGPAQVNRVPLSTITHGSLIATSTILDLGDFKVSRKINDKLFRMKKKKCKISLRQKYALRKAGKSTHKESGWPKRIAEELAVDQAIINAIKKRSDRSLFLGYLKSRFSVMKRQYPHCMKF